MPTRPPPPPAPATKMPRQLPQTLLRTDAQMPVLRHVVPGDGLPEERVGRGGLGHLEPVDLDVGEGIGFLG